MSGPRDERSSDAAIIGNLRRYTSRVLARRPTSDMSTPEQIRSAAMNRLLTEPFEVLAKGINPSRFDDWLPGLRSKAFRSYGSSVELTEAILLDGLSPDRSGLTDELIDAAGKQLMSGSMTNAELIRQLGGAYFESVRDDGAFVIQTYAWLASGSRKNLLGAFQRLYASIDQRMAAAFGFFFTTATQRKLVEPFTFEEMSIIMTSLIEGFTFRSHVDPDSVPDDLPMRAALALVAGMTQPADEEPRTVDDIAW